MEAYLYQDLFELEDSHWWHKAKRSLVIEAVDWAKQNGFFNNTTAKTKLLDVGCGTGKNLEAFQKLGETYGVDLAPAAIKFCKQRGLSQVSLVNGEKTKFKDNSFDIVTMLDVIEHADDQAMLTEAHRIVKKGGLVIITVPAHQWLWSKWDEVLHHKRRYSSQTLTAVLNKQKLQVIKVSYVYSFLVLPVLVIRKIKELVSTTEYQSDFKLSSPLVNFVLGQLSSWERILVWRLGIPFGTSLVAIATKKK